MRVARVMSVLAVSAMLVAGSTGCSLMKPRGVSQQAEKSNMELQRESALKFRSEWPDVEMIRFTREGDRPGYGAAWGVNAVATVAGKEYQVIIGPNLPVTFPTGYPPPTSSLPSRTAPLTVVYSDGTTEVVSQVPVAS